MNVTRKYHPDWGSSDPKGNAWYVLTNKRILAEKKKKYRLPKIQSMELRMINKLKVPSEDSSVTLGREKKTTTREGGKDLEVKVVGGKGNMIWYWVGAKDWNPEG
jgi:DNA-binding beta-propeller fold protein YncE